MKLSFLALSAALAAVCTPALAGNCRECGSNGRNCPERGRFENGWALNKKFGNSMANVPVQNPAFRADLNGGSYTIYGEPAPTGVDGWPVSGSKHYIWQVSINGGNKYYYLNGFDRCTLPAPGATIANTVIVAWPLK